jgi:hypothetical protein
MNLKIFLEIVELVVSVAKRHTTGRIQEDAILADNVFQIITKTVDAGRAHTAQAAAAAPSPVDGN